MGLVIIWATHDKYPRICFSVFDEHIPLICLKLILRTFAKALNLVAHVMIKPWIISIIVKDLVEKIILSDNCALFKIRFLTFWGAHSHFSGIIVAFYGYIFRPTVSGLCYWRYWYSLLFLDTRLYNTDNNCQDLILALACPQRILGRRRGAKCYHAAPPRRVMGPARNRRRPNWPVPITRRGGGSAEVARKFLFSNKNHSKVPYTFF